VETEGRQSIARNSGSSKEARMQERRICPRKRVFRSYDAVLRVSTPHNPDTRMAQPTGDVLLETRSAIYTRMICHLSGLEADPHARLYQLVWRSEPPANLTSIAFPARAEAEIREAQRTEPTQTFLGPTLRQRWDQRVQPVALEFGIGWRRRLGRTRELNPGTGFSVRRAACAALLRPSSCG
jgi:hypothetical protein